ncbi:MAG TPA: hypothetical protein VF721_21810 [Pyrinomonadaceae bacterium]|jgi:hypothetical protein
MKGKRQKAKGEILWVQIIKFGFSKGKLKCAGGNQFLFFAACLLSFAFCFPAIASAQQPDEPEVAPPPIRSISKEEKQQLEAESNVKKYTQLALSLMETRLKNAEALTTETNYREALNTLGGFQILLENTLGFLSRNNVENDKVQENLKKLELTLRGQTSRLEVVRRAMPSRYAFYVQKLIRIVRDARTKAIEPLFGETVVPQPRTKP